MAAPTPPIPSTLYSSAVGNQQLPPAAVAAQARARAGQGPSPLWAWHANTTARSMAPYSINNMAAKAIVMMPNRVRPPQRQLVPVQQPAAGAAGDRTDFFPRGGGDLRVDGTRGQLTNWGYADGMHLGRFSITGRSMAYNSHSAPASWGYSTTVTGIPGYFVLGRYPGVPLPGPMKMREERDAPLSSVERYDPAKNAWEAAAPMSMARCAPAAAVSDGKLYVMGGSGGLSLLSSVEQYNPAKDEWVTMASMALITERSCFCAVSM